MPRLFSDPVWTYPLHIRQAMADDLRDFGKITSTTLILQEDWIFSMTPIEHEEYLMGF